MKNQSCVRYICNAFSLNMLASLDASIVTREVSLAEAQRLAANNGSPLASAVGHADTAAVFADVLNSPVEAKRTTVSLVPGDQVLVGQYSGPRLAEGARELPAGAAIKWVIVSVEERL